MTDEDRARYEARAKWIMSDEYDEYHKQQAAEDLARKIEAERLQREEIANQFFGIPDKEWPAIRVGVGVAFVLLVIYAMGETAAKDQCWNSDTGAYYECPY